MATFLCTKCKKNRQVVHPAPNQKFCMRCKLHINKVLLLRCFNAIVDQDDMKEFKATMEQWYV